MIQPRLGRRPLFQECYIYAVCLCFPDPLYRGLSTNIIDWFVEPTISSGEFIALEKCICIFAAYPLFFFFLYERSSYCFPSCSFLIFRLTPCLWMLYAHVGIGRYMCCGAFCYLWALLPLFLLISLIHYDSVVYIYLFLYMFNTAVDPVCISDQTIFRHLSPESHHHHTSTSTSTLYHNYRHHHLSLVVIFIPAGTHLALIDETHSHSPCVFVVLPSHAYHSWSYSFILSLHSIFIII